MTGFEAWLVEKFGELAARQIVGWITQPSFPRKLMTRVQRHDLVPALTRGERLLLRPLIGTDDVWQLLLDNRPKAPQELADLVEAEVIRPGQPPGSISDRALEVAAILRAEFLSSLKEAEAIGVLDYQLRDLRQYIAELHRDLVERIVESQDDQNGSHRSSSAVRSLSATQLKAELVALLSRVEEDARNQLPRFLPPDMNIEAVTRHAVVRVNPRQDVASPLGYSPPSASGANYGDDEQKGIAREWRDIAVDPAVLVLGDAGMGKSWLIRTETLRLARIARESLEAGSEPGAVIVPLWSRCDELADILSQSPTGERRGLGEAMIDVLRSRYGRDIGPGLDRWLMEHAERRRLVVLLDALDETDELQKNLVLDALEDRMRATRRAETYPDRDTTADIPANSLHADDERLVLTSRLAAHPGVALPAGFRVVELMPLEPTAVEQVVQAWPLEPSVQAHVLSRLAEDQALAGMARIPLLLALLCAGVGETGELPVSRADLYRRALRRLLAREHSGRLHAPEHVESLLTALRVVAYTFATTAAPITGHLWVDRMPAEEIRAVLRQTSLNPSSLTGETEHLFQKLVDSGVLVPESDPSRGNDPPYLFMHRTFAEYLVAAHLALSPEGAWLPLVKEHLWFDPEWEPTLVLMAGQLRDPLPLLTWLLESADPFHQTLLLTARSLAEMRDPPARPLRDLGERLLGLLPHPVADIQGLTLEALHAIAPRMHDATVDALTALIPIGDEEWDVFAHHAASVLSRRKDAQTKQLLLGALRHPSVRVRITAIACLRRDLEPDVTAALAEMANDRARNVPLNLANALSDRPGIEATRILVSMLLPPPPVPGTDMAVDGLVLSYDDERSWVRRVCAERPGKDMRDALLATLHGLGDDPDSKTAEYLVDALATRPEREVTCVLFTHPSFWVRLSSILSLPASEKEVQEHLLRVASDDQDEYLRTKAVAVLGNESGEQIDEALIAALFDPQSAAVRGEAAQALAEREGSAITTALVNKARHGDASKAVVRHGLEALSERDGEEVVSELLVALDDPDPELRQIAAYGLADRDDPRVRRCLLMLGESADATADELLHAAALLVHSDEIKALELATRVLSTPPPEEHHPLGMSRELYGRLQRHSGLRRFAVRVIGAIEGEVGTKVLFSLLDHVDPEVRKAAAAELSERTEAQVVGRLLGRLHSRSPQVRRAAVRALANAQCEYVERRLLWRLDDTDASVREQTLEVLSNWPGDEVTRGLLYALDDETFDRGSSRYTIRRAAVKALQYRHSHVAVSGLSARIASGRTDGSVLDLVASWPEEDVTSALVALVAAYPDGWPYRMARAAHAMRGRAGDAVTLALVSLLRHPDEGVWVEVFAALGKAAPGECGRRLSLLGDAVPNLSSDALFGLYPVLRRLAPLAYVETDVAGRTGLVGGLDELTRQLTKRLASATRSEPPEPFIKFAP